MKRVLDPNSPICPVHGKRTGTNVQRGDFCDVIDDEGQCPLLLVYPDKDDPTDPYTEAPDPRQSASTEEPDDTP